MFLNLQQIQWPDWEGIFFALALCQFLGLEHQTLKLTHKQPKIQTILTANIVEETQSLHKIKSQLL